MTMDDERSVYVGGLPYSASEDSIRKVFSIYGAVVAVKIINDRGVRGKCYGFVTFANHRSAMHAIEDMDGRTIDGRVVKVNEVMTRGGRSNYGSGAFRHDSDRGMDWERGRDRERDYDRGRERYPGRQRERSRENDKGKDKGYENASGHDRGRDRIVSRDRGRVPDRDWEDIEKEHQGNQDLEWGRDQDLDRDGDRDMQRSSGQHKSGENDDNQISRLLSGSSFKDHHGRDLSSESSDGDCDQVEKQLQIYNQNLEELQEEVCEMEELVKERNQNVSKLHEKSQKLEDALTAAKKLTSHRQIQLTKLHKCFLNVREYTERLKSSEQELQSLVDSTRIDLGHGDDGILASGNA